MKAEHQPVLAEEVISMLAPASYFAAKKSTIALSAVVLPPPVQASNPKRHGTRAAS